MTKRKFEKPLETKKGIVKTRSGLMTVDKTIQFMDAYYRNGGNATEAALDVFNCSTRASASEMGRTYLDKAQKRGLVKAFVENSGITYGDLIKHAFEMMKKSKNPAWWDRLMKEAGYIKSLEQPQGRSTAKIEVNVNRAHKALIDEYVEGEVDDQKKIEK